MGVIWDYFKEKLRFPLIQSPGPLAQMAKGGAEAADLTRDHEIWLRDQFLANQCDDQFLSDFGASRGIRRWPYEPEVLWRDRVIRAYVFYMLGGQAAGVAQIFDMAGVDADIIEPRDSHDAWTVRGGVRLDGTWQVNGSEKLIAPYRISYAGLLAWAEFMVSAAIDDAADEAWESLLRSIVAEFKPARSIPYYRFYASAEISQPHACTDEARLISNTRLSGWSCGLRLDGTWGLGRAIRLDGSWCLNRGWQIGQTWPRGVIVNKLDGSRALDGTWQLSMVFLPHHKILDCRLETTGDIRAEADVTAWRTPGNYFQVAADSPVPLDGDYQLGRAYDRWPHVATDEWSSNDRPVYAGGSADALPLDVIYSGPLPRMWYSGGSAEHLPLSSIYGGDLDGLPRDVMLGGDYAPEPDTIIYPELSRRIILGGSPGRLPDDVIWGGNARVLPEDVIDYGLLPRTWYFGGSAEALPKDIVFGGLIEDLPTAILEAIL
jgi:hypothetical protein